MEQCKNKYGLKNKQIELIADLFRRKTSGMEWEIRLNDDEIKCQRGDLKKTKKALRELNIFFDIPKRKKQTVKWPVWEWADKTGKKEGRGAYICNSVECLKIAEKRKSLERSLKVTIPAEVYKELEKEMMGSEK